MKRIVIAMIFLSSLLLILIQPVSAANYGGVPQSDARTAPQTFITNFSDHAMKGLFSTTEQTFWIARDWEEVKFCSLISPNIKMQISHSNRIHCTIELPSKIA